jgi:hypothetical protein
MPEEQTNSKRQLRSSDHRSPFGVRRSAAPFTVHRSPFGGSPFRVHRSADSANHPSLLDFEEANLHAFIAPPNGERRTPVL